MAKKTVASLHEGSKEGRAYTKVIKMVKSPKTGAYIFDEQMVANEKVQDECRVSIRSPYWQIAGKGISFAKNRRTFYFSSVFLYLCCMMSYYKPQSDGNI